MSVGLTGFATLSLPGLMRLRAENAAKPQKERTAVIMVWLIGGLSHIDTYDPKPDASSDYRGPFKVIPTNVPGTRITELLRRCALRWSVDLRNRSKPPISRVCGPVSAGSSRRSRPARRSS